MRRPIPSFKNKNLLKSYFYKINTGSKPEEPQNKSMENLDEKLT